jgi:hypothetical protein
MGQTVDDTSSAVPTTLPTPTIPFLNIGSTSLFASIDPSTWGIGEWLIIAVGGYLVISLIGDAISAGKNVKQRVVRSKRRSAAVSKAQKQRGFF